MQYLNFSNLLGKRAKFYFSFMFKKYSSLLHEHWGGKFLSLSAVWILDMINFLHLKVHLNGLNQVSSFKSSWLMALLLWVKPVCFIKKFPPPTKHLNFQGFVPTPAWCDFKPYSAKVLNLKHKFDFWIKNKILLIFFFSCSDPTD